MRSFVAGAVVFTGVAFGSTTAFAQPPALPPGLGGHADSSANSTVQTNSSATAEHYHDVSGFGELRYGRRFDNDPRQRDSSLAEARLQINVSSDWSLGDDTPVQTHLTADLRYDNIADDHEVDLERGEGWLDIREANLVLSPAASVDLKLGRQVLTWGTGDLVFINDLFPKDWVSFFVGRYTDYLKAPSDALKASFYSQLVNVDIVYTPRFDADRFIDGRRISYFSNASLTSAGRNQIVSTEIPNDWFRDDEIALRAYRNIHSFEWALYAYSGYWKSPAGQNPVSGLATFPRLQVIGASTRGPLGNGIVNVEWGYYHSKDDRRGDNPFVRNSEQRILLGYEQELRANLTLGAQYYLEHRIDHANYLRSLPAGALKGDRNRRVATLRLTQLLMNQNLELSLVNLYSATDKDGYLRFKALYKASDNWQFGGGINYFYGEETSTFFAQFEDASNYYASVRWLY